MIHDELDKLRERLMAHEGLRFLCLATTANVHNPPLLVGSARFASGVLAGNLILRDATLLSGIVERFNDVVSLFLVDCEVKGGVDLTVQAQTLISPQRLHFFKPNDFTIEALDEWVAQRVVHRPGLRAAVIGAGNIGAKIALRLSERGFEVRLTGRNTTHVEALVQALNAIARGNGVVVGSTDPVGACVEADLVLGCTSGTPAIEAQAVAVTAPNALLMDVGNGTFSREAIAEAHRRSLMIEVLSPIAGWEGFVSRYLSTLQLQRGLGRRQLEDGLWIVSRGVMGSSGDVLVDNVSSPSRVIGVCNGTGDLLYSEEAVQKMKYVEDSLGVI